MTEKELKKLNRSELLEILVAQGEKIETLEQQLADAQKRCRIDVSRFPPAVLLPRPH